MNIDFIKKRVSQILEIGVQDEVKKLFATHSKDLAKAQLAKIRYVCGQLRLYCEFFEAKTFEHPKGRPIKTNSRTGSFVKIRPCDDKYDNKTYLGILIGEAALSSSVSIKDGAIICSWSMYNPAILIPEMSEVVYGCESFWGEIESEDDLRELTDQNINNVWYIKALKQLSRDK